MSKPLEKLKRNFSLFELLQRRVHILQWLPKYSKSDIVADFIAGISVGLTMMPQSIAYANLAGLPAQYGLYTAFIGSFTYVLFGTIKQVSIGPTSLMALLTFSYTESLSVDYVILLSLLVGCVEFLMGLLKLGFLVDFISPCVTSGFTSAMSVTIVTSQLKNLLGLRKLKNHGVFDVFYKIATRINEIRLADTLLGFSCIAFLFIFKQLAIIKTRNKALKKTLWLLSISKNALIVLITSILGYYFYEYRGGSPFVLSGKVPSGLPKVQIPHFSTHNGNETIGIFEMVQTLGSGIFVLPIAGVLANVAIAKAFVSGTIVDATQEMMTLGLCNIFGSFVQAMPSCGAFTRSAVANSSGVRTPLQGIYSGTVILLALSFLTPYFYYIPRSTLAAILISAIITMFDYEIFPKLWKCNKFDFFLTLATLIIGVCYGVEIGIIAGGLLNLLILLKVWARPQITKEIRVDSQGNQYIYIKPEVGLYYAATDYLTTNIIEAYNNRRNLPIVLDCSNIIRVDYAACQTIDNLVKTFNKTNKKVTFMNVKPHVFNTWSQTINFDNLKVCHNVDNISDSDSNKINDCQIPLIDKSTKERKMSYYDNV
ncbi:sodium-independent sulfate anion transporter-like [Tribolium madens]|uniref:sodium-independent sulfate anion transporter-like n=1 Tax=Tribolium madens TaxID=41895 RepID=UPI001CF73C97|nr:sodium-independent sulfate anion transporter-like [Tribolium madens]